MAGSLYGGGAQTNPNFREKFLSFSQKDFLSGGYRKDVRILAQQKSQSHIAND